MNDTPMWTPSAGRIAAANVTSFREAAARRWNVELPDYDALYAWSVAQPEQFWTSVWEDGDVIGERGERVLVDGDRMPGAKWFPDARLNFAQNLLRSRDAHDALVFWGEDCEQNRMSHGEFYRAVAHFTEALREQGVQKGDRVAAYMPNMPETVIAMLAAASIGAIFTSASPDFGVQGVLDRFGQTEPKVLVACDGYFYGGKTIDVLGKLGDIVRQLPSVKRVVVVPYVHAEHDMTQVPHGVMWADFIAPFHFVDNIAFEQLPFDHPLYIMYSSGTTGVPKCIVHSAGGTLLQHLKEHRLHADVRPGDRLFYFTTCGWMMWNWLVSGLAAGATLLLYDGSPFASDNQILFDYADAEHMTHFGTSAKFIDAAAKFGLKPRETHSLASVRAMMSTGSPLVPEGFDYVYRDIKADLQLSSISGGTDIISCFVLGSPVLPVWRGEIQCRGLGMAVDVWDDEGRPLRGDKGELVCTKPFPVMPIGFWRDDDGAKYQAAYFERFPDVWCHGDFCEITGHGGLVIHGRSDATLNPGGVRIGTAEIYRQVERLPEVVESLVIGQDWPPQTPNDVRVVLFVKLREGLTLDDALVARIRQTIRDNTTPRHVPAKVLQVADIPRTKSGKIVELAVRNVVHRRPVKNQEALANPEALAYFRDRAELAE
ncbi:acetoacetate--CoA ligase [Aromatoleum toluclasticum]|uniref:acetoacetate--CoA ligase n=1 Tax=Aromatoleum toluclasticum TaxID=92003 RepID=UPI000361C935|nr:acetoacetate--CoA ligase [Aromatoleum toluclasticum]